MHEFPLELFGGHFFIRHDGLTLLLDTGSPVSVGQRSPYRFLGRDVAVVRQYNDMTIPDLSEIVRTRVDMLLGADVLSRYAVAIDPEAGRVTFGSDPRAPRPRPVPLEVIGGIPVVNVSLAGRPRRVLLHTGASLSCLRDTDTRTYRSVGVARDNYPGLGEFATELRRVPMSIGDQPLTLVCGSLPPVLEQSLVRVRVHGIVGTNLLRSYKLGWAPGFCTLLLWPRRVSAGPGERLLAAVPEVQETVSVSSGF